MAPVINHEKQIYPYCIVWTPLPIITWFLPFIGHTGIGDSNGVLYDFAGPYTIGVGKLTFGAPTRYVQLDPSKCYFKEWNYGVEQGCELYSQRMHNICCDNCHSHVAQCLNTMGYEKMSSYEMIRIGVWVFFYGRFVSMQAFIQTYLPSAILILIILFTSGTIIPF